MRELFVVAAVAAVGLAGCGGSDSTGPSPAPNIAGRWIYGVNLSNAPLQVSCQGSGEFDVSQSGNSFSGTGSGTMTCTGPGGSFTDATGGSIGGGQITGNEVTFTDGECSYHGTFSGTPPNRMSGTVGCPVAISGTVYQFTGTWQAGR